MTWESGEPPVLSPHADEGALGDPVTKVAAKPIAHQQVGPKLDRDASQPEAASARTHLARAVMAG